MRARQLVIGIVLAAVLALGVASVVAADDEIFYPNYCYLAWFCWP